MSKQRNCKFVISLLLVTTCLSLASCYTTREKYCYNSENYSPCMPPDFDSLTSKNKSKILVAFANDEAKKTNYAKSIDYANEAIKLNKNSVDAYKVRGFSYTLIGENDKAINDYNNALKLDPNEFTALYLRATSYILKKQINLAILDFKHVLKINPWDIDSLRILAWLYATCYDPQYLDGKSAVELAKKAVHLRRNTLNLNTLAAAYARNGQYAEAVQTEEGVLAILKTSKRAKSSEREEAESRLTMYKAGQPYTEPEEKLTTFN